MNQAKLTAAIDKYVKLYEDNPEKYKQALNERTERELYYKKYTYKKIITLSEDEFYEYISPLWSMLIWGNKNYIVQKIINTNGFSKVKEGIAELLYDHADLGTRWDNFLSNVKCLGPSTASELLSYIYPEECAILNTVSKNCLTYLEVPNIPTFAYQHTGKIYLEICNTMKEIAKQLTGKNLPHSDLLGVDYFMWDVLLPIIEESGKSVLEPSFQPDPIKRAQKKSLHEEIKEKLIEIGNMLGFETADEKKIAHGAVVDVVWEAKIGNMGKAIYVFEVQSHGSIDSLILNLTKSRSNHAVQAVVAVADTEQLKKIEQESKGIKDIEHDLKFWDVSDVFSVHESLIRAHESINRLELVPDSLI